MVRDFNSYYRPQSLGEIIGQEVTTSIIGHQIATGQTPNVYIFIGLHGTGKTTLARVISHELGEDNPTEINGSVTNGVDDMRALNEDAQYLSITGAPKVYIIDEAHQLSKAAFSAVLKLLEEPPENTLFILCTTEVNKIPQTIMSRAQVFYLQPLSEDLICDRLGVICNDLHIPFEPEALMYLARGSMGSMREAIQKLEQISSLDSITMEAVKKVLPDLDLYKRILIDHNFGAISELANNSVSIDSLIKAAINYALEEKFPRQVAIGLVKLRLHLNTPFDPQIVRCFLEGALAGVKK